ncbi:MAG: hypothetical protein ACK4OF_00950 [Aquificaceae bacterium]
MRKLILVLLVSIAFAKEVPFTQEDRDRLIRLEVKVEALDKRMDFLQKQMADLKTVGFWHPFQWHGYTNRLSYGGQKNHHVPYGKEN